MNAKKIKQAHLCSFQQMKTNVALCESHTKARKHMRSSIPSAFVMNARTNSREVTTMVVKTIKTELRIRGVWPL